MSHAVFYLVASDPDYLPSPEQQRVFGELFMQLFEIADGHYVHLTEEPMRVGDGEVGSVTCPACGSTLDMFVPNYQPSQYFDWYYNTVCALSAYETCEMPCCRARVKAIELKLDSDYPYARFAQGALDPQMDDQWDDNDRLRPDLMTRLESLLGAPLTEVWVYGT